MRHLRRTATSLVPLLLVAAGALSGCLGEPEVDERWTLLEIVDVQPALEPVAPGSNLTLTVQARVTYRRLFTGFFAIEARYSPTLTPDVLQFGESREDDFVGSAVDVDLVLAESTAAGTAERAAVGFPELIQDVQFQLDVNVPAALSDGQGGLYLVLYLAEGEEMELPDGEEVLVLTAYPAVESEILHAGDVIPVDTGGAAP